MRDQLPHLITVRLIADAVGVTPDRVRRVLHARRHIKPVAYADQVQVFTSEAIAQVRYEVNVIDARRGGDNHFLLET